MTMEVVANNFMPGDSRLVEQLVYELKSQGIFDRFRKECISDVDTKPAYQNLRQRVEGSVSTFLRQQTWSPDMNKNQVREQLRKNIYECGYLETGVERIVDQVVNPKINTIFLPEVEDVVYRFLGVVKPVRDIKKEVKINIEDLLPTDLEAVSPESVHSFKDDIKPEDHSETLNDSLNSGSKPDEDESPPFEPLDPANKINNEENSVDSHLSGFSGLQSHGSNHSGDNRVCQMEISSQDSQLSHNSSESRLSIITSEDATKMDICEDSTSNLIKSTSNKTPTETSIQTKMDVDEIMPCDETDNTGDISMEESLGSSLNRKENESSSDNTYKVDKSENEKSEDGKNEKRDENKSDKKHDKSIEKKSKSSDRYSKDKRDDKHRKSSSSSSKDISSSKYSSSKDRDRSRKDSKSSSSTRDKEKTDKSREKTDRDKEKKDRGKDKAEKEKSDREKERDVDKSAKDKEKLDKDKSSGRDKERSDKSKDKNEREKLDKDKVKAEKSSRDKEKSTKDKEREKSDKEKERSDKDKDRSDKERDRSDREKERPEKEKERSEKEKERSDKDKERSAKEKERSDKDRERSDTDRERSDKEKERSDKDRDRSDKDRERSDKERERSDKEKDKARRDKDKSDRERSSKDKEKSARPREKSDKEKVDRHKEKYREKDKYHKEKSSKEKEPSDKEKSLDSKSSSKDKNDRPSSSSKKEQTDKEKPRSSSSSSSRDKSKLDNGDTKSRSSAEKSRKDSKHSVNGKPSVGSSDSKKDKDSKRDSKKQLKDDHYGAKDKKNDRRSTDRDSNDGSSGKPNFSGSCSENNSSRSEKSSQDFTSTSNSGSGDSGNSDQVERSEPATYEEPAPVVQDVQRLIMPKFAANFQEVRRIMKIRKQLALLDKQKRLGFTHIESQVLVENGLPGKAKAIRPVKPKKPAKKQPCEKRKMPVEGKENVREQKDIEENVRLGESLELICEEVADAGIVGADVSLEQDAEETRAESPDSPWDSTSLRSTELSQENWEALEARLAQEMSTVNCNSYESDEEMVYSASPRMKETAEAPEAAADASNFDGSDPKSCSNESEGFRGFPKEEGASRCLEFLRSFISESIGRYPALADADFGQKVAGGEVKRENNAQNNNKELSIVIDKNDVRKNNHRLEPAVENCRYLDKPLASEEANLRFLRGFIGKLEEELRVCTEARRVSVQPAKRGRKRKLEEIVDVKNNNRDNYDQVVVRKRGRPPGSHTVLSKVNKEKMCNTTDLLTHEKFSLPLSPAESDKSNDKKEEELLIPEKRRRIIATQRYSSEDLYKPRPIFCRRNKDTRKS